MNTRTLTLALGSACLGLALWASALPVGHADSSDHELARQALQQGKVLPLRTALAASYTHLTLPTTCSV